MSICHLLFYLSAPSLSAREANSNNVAPSADAPSQLQRWSFRWSRAPPVRGPGPQGKPPLISFQMTSKESSARYRAVIDLLWRPPSGLIMSPLRSVNVASIQRWKKKKTTGKEEGGEGEGGSVGRAAAGARRPQGRTHAARRGWSLRYCRSVFAPHARSYVCVCLLLTRQDASFSRQSRW